MAGIEEDERRRRQVAVAAARASVELEGFKLDEEELTRARRFIDGELSLEEFIDEPAAADSNQSLG